MDDLEKLKKLSDTQVKEKAKIEGKIESLMETLKSEGYKDIALGTKALKTLGSKIKKMKITFKEKTNVFKERYANELAKIS